MLKIAALGAHFSVFCSQAHAGELWPRTRKHRKLRWYSDPASYPAPCWARSRTTKTTENTVLGFKYVQITIVLGGEGTASAMLDTAQNANNLVKKSCVSQVFTPSKASVIRKIRLFGIL